MNKTITAVIPNYNYAHFLPARVKSILKQKYQISELIFLDDCSTDDSIKVINNITNQLRESHPDLKVKIFNNNHNTGNVFKQWSRAFKEASSDYLWICEADDLCDENLLYDCMKSFEKDEKTILSYTNSKMIDEVGRVTIRNLRSWSGYDGYDHWKHDYINNGLDEIKKYLAINNTIINVSSVVFKIKKGINYERYLNSASKFRLAGDWYFYAKILAHGNIAYCAKPHNYYRAHSGSVSGTTDPLVHYKEIISIQNEIAKEVEIPEPTQRLINRRRSELIKKWNLEDKMQKIPQPLISVIIPAYNIENYLTECLDSVLAQSYKNYEIIVVDDGSKDGTRDICDIYQKKFDKIKVIRQQNAGLSAARNSGIKKAKGEYLAFVDGDDLVAPNFLVRLWSIIELADADIVECQYATFQETKPTFSQAGAIFIKTREEAVSNLLVGQENVDIVTWNKLYKKVLYNNISFPAGELHEDNLTTYKVFAESSSVAVVDDKLYYYREREGSIMAEQKILNRLNQKERASKEAIKYFKNDLKLSQAAEVALLLSRFAYLDNIASGKIHDKALWKKTVSEINTNHQSYKTNPYLTKKLKLYLKLLRMPILYKLFRKIVHE